MPTPYLPLLAASAPASRAWPLSLGMRALLAIVVVAATAAPPVLVKTQLHLPNTGTGDALVGGAGLVLVGVLATGPVSLIAGLWSAGAAARRHLDVYVMFRAVIRFLSERSPDAPVCGDLGWPSEGSMIHTLRPLVLRESGQVLMMTALLLPALLGFTAMAVDLGSYSGERRSLQNAADSMALAAIQEMCESSCSTYNSDQASATTKAHQWAVKNDIDPADVTVTFPGSATDPRVRVRIERSHEFSFIRVLGVNEAAVAGAATTAKVSLGGGTGVVPWTITQQMLNQVPTNGNLVTIKYDSTANPSPGNFAIIRIDGSGANVYGDSAMYGASQVACAVGTANCTTQSCPGSYPATCAETSPPCDGPVCNPETGNAVGPTRAAVDFRMNYTSAACDTFEETFSGPDADGKYQLSNACNPWNGAGVCDSRTDICSRRVMIIPVVDQFGNGQTPVEIQTFALVYLEGYAKGKCQGNSCEIMTRFVKADVSVNGLGGQYDPSAAIHFWKLVE